MSVPLSQHRGRFKGAALLAFGVQLLLADCAIAVAVAQGVPWMVLPGFGLAVVLAMGVSRRAKSKSAELLGWWFGSFACLAGLLFWRGGLPWDEISTGAFVSFLGVTALVAALRLEEPITRAQWRRAGLMWALAGAAFAVAISYKQNLAVVFFLAVLFLIGLLTLYKRWYRASFVVIQLVNTLVLLCAGLLVVGLAQRRAAADNLEPAGIKTLYKYADAQKDPIGYRRWWALYWEQWSDVISALYERHPGTPLYYHPRPGSQAMFLESRVRMNRLGFRGAELAEPKGDTYRIVALGESSTFGSTIRPNDKTWPEQLEQMIRERLKPRRPVEVVNAGTPNYRLTNNLFRLSQDILPLKPDVLISYHGYNGFHLLSQVARPERSLYPPIYRSRPVKLLADSEYHLRVMLYRRRRSAERFDPMTTAAAMQTEYARAYQQLIAVARTNSIHLVLATYSMAVDRQSDPAVINFYREIFPDAPVSIQANEVHSRMVRKLCQENPETIFVDTRPGLDGQHDLFLDLVHLSNEGNHQLAEAIFQGLKPVLEHDLAGRTN